jgi:ankyrin repeat protein
MTTSEKPFTKQLLSAAANQDLAGVNAVLQSGSSAFDINATNKSGYSPLHFAADNDSVSIIKKLIKVEGINVNLKGGHVRILFSLRISPHHPPHKKFFNCSFF